MERKSWYLIAYDIADPRRLAKIHRFFKKNGVAAQKSVFLVNGTKTRIDTFMDEIADMMNLREDDLRAYPIEHPSKVWTFGINPLAECPVVTAPEERKPDRHEEKSKPSWWTRLMKRYR